MDLVLTTFSIVARCERTGDFGVAVATAIPSVGSLCPFVSLQGAIAVQSALDGSMGARALELLRQGTPIQHSLQLLLAEDAAKETRQIHGVDTHGTAYAFTGSSCRPWAAPR